MTFEGRTPFPFKIIPQGKEAQEAIAKDFLGLPSGLASCNHWGFKLSATVTEEELEDAYNHPLDPRDVWLVTPPKCGTTWTQEMVWLLANDLDYEGAKTPLTPDRWSFLDMKMFVDKQLMANMKKPSDTSESDNVADNMAGDPHRPSPRFVKSHLPLSMNNPRLLDVCKVVYVARNPKDVCVFYYKHARLIRLQDFVGDFELLMKYFMDAYLPESPIIEHVIEAWNLRHHPNLCVIFYEDMKRDLKSQIRKVATFLGKSFSDEQVDKLAEHLHIDNFRNNPYVNLENLKQSGLMHQDRGSFIRKGKTGDWKNHFTPEMTARFDMWMAEKMKGTDLKFVEELDKQD